MSINPDNITTIRVDQLAAATLNLTNEFPHSEDATLKKATIQSLVDLVSTAVGSGSGVGFLPISVTDGQQLPGVPADPSFFLCGQGTYLNINGYPNVVCTDELNAVMSLTDHWQLSVGIPITADLQSIGISQSVNDGVLDKAPSENAVYDFISQWLPKASLGYFDYADLATQTTPITVLPDTQTLLTNDTLGDATNTSQPPYGVTAIWDADSDEFNFQQLSVGDTVDLRIHLKTTTTTANQKYHIDMKFAFDSPDEFENRIFSQYVKNASEDEQSFVTTLYIGSESVRTYPARLYITSDDDATVEIVGWFCRVFRKSVNIVSVDEAPIDGLTYGRKDAEWVEVSGGGSVGTLQQVTDNGNTTTNDIKVSKLYLKDSASELNGRLYLDSNNWFFEDSDGVVRFIATEGSIFLKNRTSEKEAVINTNLLTANRTYTLPDTSGTIALNSDIPTVDATPTDGSSNAVSSNGVFDGLTNKLDKNTAIVGATKTKITYDTNGLVTAGADATTADINDTTTRRYVTDTQISTWNAMIGGSIFQSVWNASTNSPSLSSGVGTKGFYYIVNVDGTTNLDGINDWKIGDWAIFDGTVWRKVDNTDAISSFNGRTGAITLLDTDVLPLLLSGLSAASGTYTSSDTILTAFGKIKYLIDNIASTYQAILTDVNFGSFLNGLTAKTTPVDADSVNIVDSADSNKAKKVSLANFKAFLKTYFDGLYSVPCITITTSSSIDTDTTGSGYTQHGRNTKIANSTNAINLTVQTTSNADFVASYTKIGSATITFVAGSGATLVQLSGTAALTGSVGSTACLTRNGNTYYLQITNY